MKKPRRVYSNPDNYSQVHSIWMDFVRMHKARILKNGENPTDYPVDVVAFETQNFGWILSMPSVDGKRSILVKF